MLNVHGPEGLDDVCPLCRIAELEADYEQLKAERGAVFEDLCDLQAKGD
jgi:hypothetical protein